MNLMQGGFLLVLFAIVEIISGLTSDKSVVNNQTQDLPAAHISTEKSQQVNGVTDSLKIITQTNTTSSTTPSPSPPTPPPTPAPTPKPAPSPALSPAPNSGNTTWVIRNSTTHNVCIIAEMSMQLNITYPSTKRSLIDALVNIPKNATVSGSCLEPIQTMIISWGPNHTLQFNFSANKASKNFFVSGINLSVNSTVFKDANANTQLWNFENRSSEFTTPLEMSYKCIKVQDVNLKSNDDKLKAVLSLKDTQLQAFMNKTSPDFEAAQNCDTFDTPDIVPIAVGCALAILVLVVLVAYLIGRKRSQNRGYLSM